jgi:ribosomal protein S18 acetylase RimI-like enzyme
MYWIPRGAAYRLGEFFKPMVAIPQIIYGREATLRVEEFKRVLVESGLGATRPVEDLARLEAMLSNSNLITTARLDKPGRPLVGVARSITDFAWCCYLSDLAVTSSMQGYGVGRSLMDEMQRQLGAGVSIILISLPEAVGFYERAGLTKLPNTFWHKRQH